MPGTTPEISKLHCQPFRHPLPDFIFFTVDLEERHLRGMSFFCVQWSEVKPVCPQAAREGHRWRQKRCVQTPLLPCAFHRPLETRRLKHAVAWTGGRWTTRIGRPTHKWDAQIGIARARTPQTAKQPLSHKSGWLAEWLAPRHSSEWLGGWPPVTLKSGWVAGAQSLLNS